MPLVLADFGKLARVEKIVGHELDDQGHVDMHGALQLGQGPDVPGGHLEIHVLFKSLGGNDVPQEVDHLLALGGHLHLDHGGVEQVAPVFGRRRAHVVRVSQGKQLHGHQPGVGVDEQLPDVGKIGDMLAVQNPVGGMGDGFVKGMGTDADGGPAQVVFAHIDGVERRHPRHPGPWSEYPPR